MVRRPGSAYDGSVGMIPQGPKRSEREAAAPGFWSPGMTRQQIETAWRWRVEQASEIYRSATRAYRTLLAEEPDGSFPGLETRLARARRAESEALREYSRVLHIFSDLTMHGKLPEQPVNRSREIPPEPAQKPISVVDDDESIRDSTRTLLRSAGYTVATFSSAELFLDSSGPAETRCIILDIRMPGMNGLELQRRLKASPTKVPIIFLTAHDDARSRRMAMEQGAADFLCKPFDPNTLLAAVETALTRQGMDPVGG